MSSSELRAKLDRKAQVPADVQGVMNKLQEYGFLNDKQFAEGFASARRDTQSFGKQRVLRDLRQRRVSSAIANKAVEQVFDGVNEDDAVRTYLQRKYRNVNLPEYLQEPKHLQSAYRRLRYAGFSSTAAIRALKSHASAAEQLDDMNEEEL